ncbi:MAG: ion transporter, partial [Xanthomonadales bacterium]|nr:ion transporter [Xanthomonadales bacterium]
MNDHQARPGNSGLGRLLASAGFNHFITAVIVLNAISLGLETVPALRVRYGGALQALDTLALWIFTLELTLKLYAWRGR